MVYTKGVARRSSICSSHTQLSTPMQIRGSALRSAYFPSMLIHLLYSSTLPLIPPSHSLAPLTAQQYSSVCMGGRSAATVCRSPRLLELNSSATFPFCCPVYHSELSFGLAQTPRPLILAVKGEGGARTQSCLRDQVRAFWPRCTVRNKYCNDNAKSKAATQTFTISSATTRLHNHHTIASPRAATFTSIIHQLHDVRSLRLPIMQAHQIKTPSTATSKQCGP